MWLILLVIYLFLHFILSLLLSFVPFWHSFVPFWYSLASILHLVKNKIKYTSNLWNFYGEELLQFIKLNLLLRVGRKLVVLCSFLAISYERYYVILILCPYYIQDNDDDDFEDWWVLSSYKKYTSMYKIG